MESSPGETGPASPGREAASTATDLLLGPLYVATLLLVASGVAKARNPIPTAQALLTAGWPHRPAFVRALGGVELAAAGTMLVEPRYGAAAVGALYGGFFAFLASVLLRDVDMASCGCTGATDTPPTWLHASFNLAVTACAAGGALLGARSTAGLVHVLGPSAVIFAVAVAIAAWLAYLIVQLGPRLFAPAYPSKEA